MIESMYQIDFITTAGSLRLVSVGDWIEADIAPKVSQPMAQYAPIGAAWGETVAEGGAMVSVDFSVVKNHASHAALRDYCMAHVAEFPGGKTGTLRMAISGGGAWDITAATLVSCSPMALLPSGSFETLTAYSATGGKMVGQAGVGGVPVDPPPVDPPPGTGLPGDSPPGDGSWWSVIQSPWTAWAATWPTAL